MSSRISAFKSHSAFSTGSTILGTLIGSMTGIYLPIGALPTSLQMMIKAFPVSYVASLFREVLMEVPIQIAFEGVPAQYLNEFKEYMGGMYSIGGNEITPWISMLILTGTAAVFYGLSLWNMSRKAYKFY